MILLVQNEAKQTKFLVKFVGSTRFQKVNTVVITFMANVAFAQDSFSLILDLRKNVFEQQLYFITIK